MVIIFRSAIIGVGAQLTLGARHFYPKMYVHENVVKIFFFWGGGYISLYTPRVYVPGTNQTQYPRKASRSSQPVFQNTRSLPTDRWTNRTTMELDRVEQCHLTIHLRHGSQTQCERQMACAIMFIDDRVFSINSTRKLESWTSTSHDTAKYDSSGRRKQKRMPRLRQQTQPRTSQTADIWRSFLLSL